MKKHLVLWLITSTLCFANPVPEPYRSIVDLPFDDHGWFVNGSQLKPLLTSRKPMTIIEIGSWLGSSTRFLAENMPDEAILYAVDTWKGSPAEQVHMKDPRLPYLYQLFLSNVKHAGLAHKIIPIRMESMEAAQALNVKADLIYIDAAHDTESVKKDILNWSSHLNPGGLLCGDDWGWGSVRQAIMECALILKKHVNAEGNFWWYD